MPTLPDEIAPLLAKWLAPYVAEELSRTPQDRLSDHYDAATCAVFVREIGTGVLNRAADFFMKLDRDGEVDSVALAAHLMIGTPKNIPANLTNSLKQRARKLGLDRPWSETENAERRTVWRDRDGIAARMVVAINAEHHRRALPSAPGGV